VVNATVTLSLQQGWDCGTVKKMVVAENVTVLQRKRNDVGRILIAISVGVDKNRNKIFKYVQTFGGTLGGSNACRIECPLCCIFSATPLRFTTTNNNYFLTAAANTAQQSQRVVTSV